MIILAELRTRLADGWSWVDTAAPQRQGTVPVDAVPPASTPGAVLPLEVDWRRAQWLVRRVLAQPTPERRGSSPGPAVGPVPWDDRRVGRLAGGRGEGGLDVGDLIVADIRFTNRPGPRDRERDGKARPCLVVGVDHDEITVRPVFGSNSAVRREGIGRRIRDWRAAGLRKPSYVGARDHYVPAAGTGRRFGRLTDEDLCRLFDRQAPPR